MNLPDPKQTAEMLVELIARVTSPTRTKVEQLEAEVAELRAEIVALRAIASGSRPRSAA